MPNRDPIINSLLREREGYVRTGRDDMVAGVDAELAKRGHSEPAKPEPAKPEPAAPEPPAELSKVEPETASLEATETAAVRPGRPRRSAPNA